jgi:hypothetical protein
MTTANRTRKNIMELKVWSTAHAIVAPRVAGKILGGTKW